MKDLTKRQARLLYTVAFNDSLPSTWLMKSLFGSAELSNAQKDLSSLDGGKWMGFGKVRPERYLEVVEHLIKHDSSFLERLKGSDQMRYGSVEFLWELSCLLAMDDYKSVLDLSRPKDLRIDLAGYLAGISLTGKGKWVKHLLTQSEKCEIVEIWLRDALMNDSFSEELFDHITDYISGQKLSDDILDMISFYHWVYCGVWLFGHSENNQSTRWSLGKAAIDELYHGNVADAMKLFHDALEMNRQFTDDRNCFDDPILCWFHVVCVSRASGLKGSDARRNALSKSSTLKFSDNLSESRILNQFIEDDYAGENDDVTYAVDTLLGKCCNSWHQSLCYLLIRFFKCKDAKSLTDKYDLGKKPSSLLLQHELSSYLPMEKREKDALRALYDGPSSLSALYRKEPWELLFDGIGSTIESESRQGTRRIAYYFEGTTLSSVVEQTLGSNGVWKGSKPLSRREFMWKGFDFMNEADLKISSALRNNDDKISDAAIVFPHLIGSDRLYTGNYYDSSYHHAKVGIETATLSFIAKGTRIEISSNVSLDSEGLVPKCVVTQTGLDSYKCILIDNLQRNILQKFLGIGSLPISAARSLSENVEKLGGILDVYCDLTTAVQLPAIPGSSQLAVRVTPDETDYRVCVQASPLPGGSQRFSPGEGEIEIYDSSEGITSRVCRDLLEEYSNYERLRDCMKGSRDLDFESYQEVVLGSSESLLKLLEFTHENPDRYFMEWPQGQLLKCHSVSYGGINIQVQTNVGWFDIEGYVDLGEGQTKSLAELMTMYHNSEVDGYLRIGQKEYLKMSASLRRTIEEFDQIGRLVRDKIKIPLYQVGSIGRLLNGTSIDIHSVADGAFNDILKRMEDACSSTPKVPDTLNATLRDYQKEGFEWMARLGSWGAGACLADDMGLGKTLQTLTALLYFSSEGPSLVVAPLSIVPGWVDEAAKFTPSLNLKVLNDQTDRSSFLAGLGPGDVVLTTYGVLVSESEKLSKVDWNVVCLDEAHQIKNRGTRASAAAMGLSAKRRVILTGTPVQNHLGELWNLFQFINPGLLGPWKTFYGQYIKEELTSGKKKRLQRLISPFILRRTKMDVLEDLPEKNTYIHPVELTRFEMQTYEDETEYQV
ncbi:MAG: SNF2-related protein [Bacteroidales bacterium]|nr:SNF2-related protein [Bacteroidales bacterium]